MGPEVLQDLSFSIEPGSFQFLTGPSGAGKTTLMKLLLLSLRPTRGLISLFGQDSSQLGKDAITAIRRRIGVVFQDFRLLDHLTTYENVALPLRVQNRRAGAYRDEVVELLRWVGLGERMHVYPEVYLDDVEDRFGRPTVRRCQARHPLAHEPTGNVDPAMARRIIRLFVELQRSGTSVVVATHDLGLMDQFDGARRLVLGDSRLHIYE